MPWPMGKLTTAFLQSPPGIKAPGILAYSLLSAPFSSAKGDFRKARNTNELLDFRSLALEFS